MRLLSIGYGRTLFDTSNPERARLAACAEALGHVHHVVFSRRTDGLAPVHGGTLDLLPTDSRSRIGMAFDAYRLCARLLRGGDIDVVTAQDPLISGLIAWLLSVRFNKPLVLQEHGDILSGPYWARESFGNRLWYHIARLLLRRATVVRSVSVRVSAHLIAAGVPKERVVLLPVFSPVAAPRADALGKGLRERLLNASVIVLSVARFVPQKNLPMLIRAFGALAAEDPRAELVLVGRGPLERELKALVEAMGLARRVTFMPWSDDVFTLMRSADIYALSSNYEGWARVLPEAMACGLPAVTTDVGCAGEVFMDGRHGAVVPVGDERAFGDALVRLAKDQDLRALMREAARVDALRTHGDLSTYARAWASVYSDAVTRH